MSATRLMLHGASGRMGKAVMDVLGEFPRIELVGTLERKGEIAALEAFDVMIDFSAPQALSRTMSACAARSAALISGTTGLTAEDEAGLERLAQLVPVLHANNFSLGLAALQRAVADHATRLDWDCEIVETHHREKRDAPSGTALTLVRAVREARSQAPRWVDRIAESIKEQTHQQGSVGVASLRGGGVVGDHAVMFFGRGERIACQHHAEDRLIFARGALEAAQRIRGMDPARYRLEQVLWH